MSEIFTCENCKGVFFAPSNIRELEYLCDNCHPEVMPWTRRALFIARVAGVGMVVMFGNVSTGLTTEEVRSAVSTATEFSIEVYSVDGDLVDNATAFSQSEAVRWLSGYCDLYLRNKIVWKVAVGVFGNMPSYRVFVDGGRVVEVNSWFNPRGQFSVTEYLVDPAVEELNSREDADFVSAHEIWRELSLKQYEKALA